MERITTIKHNDREILFVDFRNIRTEEEFLDNLAIAVETIQSKPKNSVLSLTNLENAFYNKNIITQIQENLKGNEDYIIKSAMIGINPVLSLIVSGVAKFLGRDLNIMGSKEEALDWLAE